MDIIKNIVKRHCLTTDWHRVVQVCVCVGEILLGIVTARCVALAFLSQKIDRKCGISVLGTLFGGRV